MARILKRIPVAVAGNASGVATVALTGMCGYLMNIVAKGLGDGYTATSMDLAIEDAAGADLLNRSESYTLSAVSVNRSPSDYGVVVLQGDYTLRFTNLGVSKTAFLELIVDEDDARGKSTAATLIASA